MFAYYILVSSHEKIYWHLKQLNVLQVLSEADKRKLSQLVKMHTYRRGERINFSSLLQQHIYFLKKGSLKLYKIAPTGDTHSLELLGPGEIFGRLLPSENLPDDQIDMQVTKDCVLCYIEEEVWNEYLSNQPALALSVIKKAGNKIRKLESKISSLQFRDTPSRINQVILELGIEHGRKIGVGFETEISLSLTHQDIAILAGTTRQSVTTQLRQLEKENIISYNRKRILIKDRSKL